MGCMTFINQSLQEMHASKLQCPHTTVTASLPMRLPGVCGVAGPGVRLEIEPRAPTMTPTTLSHRMEEKRRSAPTVRPDALREVFAYRWAPDMNGRSRWPALPPRDHPHDWYRYALCHHSHLLLRQTIRGAMTSAIADEHAGFGCRGTDRISMPACWGAAT